MLPSADTAAILFWALLAARSTRNGEQGLEGAMRYARTIGRVLSETSREAFGQAIPPKSLQDEIDKDARFGRQQGAGREIN